MPRVSVIIPSFNCAEWVRLAIESVYAQTFQDFELILVDDGSTDSTPAVIEQYRVRPRFHYLRQVNGGLSRARNSGAQIATGKYVVFLDADDEFEPNALEIMVAEADQRNAPWIVTDVLKLFEGRAEQYISAIPKGELFIGILRTDYITWGNFFRRDVFFEVGLFDEAIKIREDWDIKIRMLERHKEFVYIPLPLYRYRRRENSIMTQTNREPILRYTQSLLRKHHKRLADAGDRRVASIYAKHLWRLGRSYFFKTRRPLKAASCIAEALRYDPALPAVAIIRRFCRLASLLTGSSSREQDNTVSD